MLQKTISVGDIVSDHTLTQGDIDLLALGGCIGKPVIWGTKGIIGNITEANKDGANLTLVSDVEDSTGLTLAVYKRVPDPIESILVAAEPFPEVLI